MAKSTKTASLNSWQVSEKQFEVLQNCSKLNNFLYINKDSDVIISINALDDFSAFYVSEDFKFKTDRDNIVLHNLSNVIKTIKTIGLENSKITFNENKFDVTSNNEKIKCNYLYAPIDSVSTIKEIYKNYKDIISGVKDNPDSKTFKFSKEYFASVKLFNTGEYNTLTFLNNAIVLYDKTGSTKIDEKSNIEISIDSDITEDIRFDIDLNLFNIINPSDYVCTLSPDGFILFQNETGDTYGLASNILED